MFRNSMKWRIEFQADDLAKNFKPTDILMKYVPGGTTGFDRNNRPIYLLTAKELDLEGIFRSVTKTDLQKFFILKMEELREICRSSSEKVYN